MLQPGIPAANLMVRLEWNFYQDWFERNTAQRLKNEEDSDENMSASVFLLGLCSKTANTIKATVTADVHLFFYLNVAFALLKHFTMTYCCSRSLTLTAVASFTQLFLDVAFQFEAGGRCPQMSLRVSAERDSSQAGGGGDASTGPVAHCKSHHTSRYFSKPAPCTHGRLWFHGFMGCCLVGMQEMFMIKGESP